MTTPPDAMMPPDAMTPPDATAPPPDAMTPPPDTTTPPPGAAPPAPREAPMILIRPAAGRARLVHTFAGGAGAGGIVVVTPDRREAVELAQAMRARQAERLRERGSAYVPALERQRAPWVRS